MRRRKKGLALVAANLRHLHCTYSVLPISLPVAFKLLCKGTTRFGPSRSLQLQTSCHVIRTVAYVHCVQANPYGTADQTRQIH